MLDIGAETRRAVRDRLKGSDFLETCVRDIKALLTTPDTPEEALTDPFDGSDIVMLWDENGRTVSGGTAYDDLDATDDFDHDFGEGGGG